MPLLVLVNGKVAFGHLAVGYAGLLLLGAASVSIGLLGSALGHNQLAAVKLGASLLVAMLVLWLVAKVCDPPMRDLLAALALHGRHFAPFQRGELHLRDVVYYLGVTYFFLLCAVKVLEARRWR